MALLVRLAAAAFWQHTADSEGRLFRLGDSHSYWVLANQIGQGLPYQYGSSESRIFRAPLYPLLLAPLTQLPDERWGVWWGRVVGCALGTVCVGLVGWLAYRLSGRTAGLIALGLAAVYPGAIGMSIVLLSEAVFMPLMLGYLLAWQAAWQAGRLWQVGPSGHSGQGSACWRYAILAGSLAGAAVLARPSLLLFLPFTWVLGMLTSCQRQRHTVIFCGSLLGLSIVMSPWWVRNALITGHFVPTTLQVGPSLLDGWHEGATGASDEGMAFMEPIIAEQIREDARLLAEGAEGSVPPQSASTFEYRINARAQRVAWEWARANPLEVLNLAGRKFLRIWSLWPDGGDVSSTSIRLAMTLSSFSILLLALGFSVWGERPLGWIYAILWIPSLYFTLLHMVFVGSIRYREPALIVLLAVAAAAIASLFLRSVQREDDLASATSTSSD